MFNFFKNKKGNVNAPSKVLVFALTFLITFSAVFLTNTKTTEAQFLPIGAAVSAGSALIDSAPSVLFEDWVFVPAAQAMLHLSSWVLWAAAEVLQTVIQYSVVDVERYIDSEGVTRTWETFRDIANMFFIFMILYAAINIILGTGDSNLKKLLSRIVIVALLINFSFFFTKVAIDASNILAISFYNQIINTGCGASGESVSNIGAVFACKMGLTSFWDVEALRNISAASGGGISASFKILIMGIMGSIFFLIAAFVFLAAGIMFIARFVKLIYLFIMSPVAFASRALDQEKHWKKWVGSLMDVCIFPPAFMILTWATLSVLNGVVGDLSQAKLVDAVVGTSSGRPAPGAGGVILNFAIVIGLMLGTLIIAKDFGASGAGWGLKMLDKGTSWAQGKVGRGTVRALGINKLDEKFGNSQFGKSWYGSALRGVTTAKAVNYDFGSGYSVVKMDKARKDIQKKFAEDVIKDEEKAFEKEELPQIRMKSVAALGDTLSSKNNQLAELNKNIEKLQETIKKETTALEEKAKAAGMDIPRSENMRIEEMVTRLNSMKSQVKNIEAETKKTSTEIKTTVENMAAKAPATKQEKGTGFVERLGRKAVEMSTIKTSALAGVVPGYQKDRDAVVKELKKKSGELKAAARANKKDAKEAVRELLEELEEKKDSGGETKEGGEKEGGKGGGEGKK